MSLDRFEYISYEVEGNLLKELHTTTDLIQAINSLSTYHKSPTVQGLIRAKDIITERTTIIYITPPPNRYSKVAARAFYFFGEKREIGDLIDVPISFTSPGKTALVKGKYRLIHRTSGRAILLYPAKAFLSSLKIHSKYWNPSTPSYKQVNIQEELEITKKEYPVLFMNPELKKKKK